MGWFKFCLMVASVLIGGSLLDGFTNHLGAALMAIGFGLACYYDGMKAGKRDLLVGKE